MTKGAEAPFVASRPAVCSISIWPGVANKPMASQPSANPTSGNKALNTPMTIATATDMSFFRATHARSFATARRASLSFQRSTISVADNNERRWSVQLTIALRSVARLDL